MLQEVGQKTTERLTIGGIKESFKAFVVKYFLQGKYYSDDELRFMYENGQGHLTLFCIVFV